MKKKGSHISMSSSRWRIVDLQLDGEALEAATERRLEPEVSPKANYIT